MKKKFKLFATIASISMSLALMVFGVIAATSVNVTINSNVSYTAEGVAFKLYGKSELMTSQPTGPATDLTEGAGSTNPADTVITVGVTNAGTDSMTLPAQTFTASSTWVVYTFTVENIGSNTIEAITVNATASDTNVTATADTPTGNLAQGAKETFRCYFHLDNPNQSISQNGTSVTIFIGEPSPTDQNYMAPNSLAGFVSTTDEDTTTWTRDHESFAVTTSIEGTTATETCVFTNGDRTTTFETTYDTSNTQTLSSQAFSNTFSSNYIIADRTLTSCSISSSSPEIVIPEWLNIVATMGTEEYRVWPSMDFPGLDDSGTFYHPVFEDDVTSVIFPSTLKVIGDNTFHSGENSSYQVVDYEMSLEHINIPASVTTIGDYAFCNCSNLTSITFASGSQLESIGDYAFYYCSSLTSIEIPAGVTSIGERAFAACISLASIEIPAGVTRIEGSAFNSCSSLTSITIPANVTSIGTNAFYECSSLTSIEIPAGVTSIGGYAFQNCNSLSSATFADPSGWWRASSSTASGTSISSSDLSNASTAATYLKSTYCRYYWKKS